MAKRKRLVPPQPDAISAPDAAASSSSALEAKAFPLGVAPTRINSRPPIAQVAGDSAAAAALTELTDALTSARAEGRLAQPLPLDAIDAQYLVRDRIHPDSPEMEELVASLRARGQRTAIEVVDLGDRATPRYGLISGWRRLTALRRIAAEEGTPLRVAAILRTPDTAAEAYLSMVEENEIRLGLSPYERARIVLKALDEGVFDTEREALQSLFAHVSRAKRSRIKSFMAVVRALDGILRFPEALSERTGLDLARALETDVASERLRAALAGTPADTPEAEAALLTEALKVRASKPVLPRPKPAPPSQRAPQPVYIHYTGAQIALSGPGVDDDLAEALQAWLCARGNFEP